VKIDPWQKPMEQFVKIINPWQQLALIREGNEERFMNSPLFSITPCSSFVLLDSKVQRAHVERPCPKLFAIFSGWQSVVGCPKIKRCAQAPKT